MGYRVKAEVMDAEAMDRALTRIAHEILEANKGAGDIAIAGIMTRGVDMATRLAERIERIEGTAVPVGSLDISFYRDDVATRLSPEVHTTDIPYEVEGRTIVLVDDVLYTGRTTRAALNELFDFGRPAAVELAVLVDRGSRELPIAARYCAHTLPEALPHDQSLELQRDAAGGFTLKLTQRA